MDFTWLHGLLYGFLCGFSQFLPVSAEAHRVLFFQLTGIKDEGSFVRLAVHLAALLALLTSCWPQLSRMRREKRLAAILPRRRKRQPDKKTLLDIKLIRTAAVPLLLSLIGMPMAEQVIGIRYWLVAAVLVINGIVLYSPQFMPGANKDSRMLSAWDAVLIGLSGALSVIPGLSRVGMMISVGTMRGADRRYILEIALLLCIPLMIALCLMDFFSFGFSGMAVSGALLLSAVAAAAAAFAGSLLMIHFLRFLSVSAGFSGFAYYSWGLALFIFILYLTI